MTKPKSMPVSGAQPSGGQRRKDHGPQGPEPLSGSKKVKQANHVDHHNPQG
ncbi:small acid-soluble spore protein P [Paenibacillus monticola]|uniref:Small acid-soluble spore protein P n=1 Tax=Paenibacillus monticola TaxID=2666075 RepID=A0A7X2HC11_9BACL|nr:small acid-soluble spore protein P [Paenibacillus monticola]MRN57311.1 small acid-soluble spore protein P [Paenibacillus monticola]